MNTDNRVNIRHRFTADVTSCGASIVSLFITTVNSPESFEESLKIGRETIISLDLGKEKSIAAAGNTI
jgi:hypothetical protein